MNTNQNQLYQVSGSTRSASLTRATGHPYAPVHQIHTTNPPHTPNNSSNARTQPYSYSSHSFSIQVSLPSTNISNSASTTPSRPFPVQPSSIAPPRDNTRAVPSKRALDYTPGPPTLYRASPIHPSSDRPAKRSRLDMGPPRTVPNRRGSQLSVSVKPAPQIQPSSLRVNPSRLMLMHKKAPLGPLAADHGRPIQSVVPQPPSRRLNLQQNQVLHGPLPRNNKSTHHSERLTNLNTTAVEGNGDAGSEEVSDLYRGVVQSSKLSMELEFAAGGGSGLGVSWEAANSSLEVSIGCKSGKLQGSQAEYRWVAGAGKVVSRPAIPKGERSVDIEWSYQSCGYTTGRVVNSQEGYNQPRQQWASSTSANPPHRH